MMIYPLRQAMLLKLEKQAISDANKGIYSPPHERDNNQKDKDENDAYKGAFLRRRKELGDNFIDFLSFCITGESCEIPKKLPGIMIRGRAMSASINGALRFPALDDLDDESRQKIGRERAMKRIYDLRGELHKYDISRRITRDWCDVNHLRELVSMVRTIGKPDDLTSYQLLSMLFDTAYDKVRWIHSHNDYLGMTPAQAIALGRESRVIEALQGILLQRESDVMPQCQESHTK